MATSTQLSQALALRKQNPDLTVGEAVSQIKAQSIPAPVAPATQTPLPEAKAGDVVVGQGGEKFIQANNKDMTTVQQGPSQVVNQSGQDLSKLQQVQAQAYGRREGMNTQGVMPTNPNPVQAATPVTTTPVETTPATPVTATPTQTTAPTPAAKQTPVVQPTDENSIMAVLKTNGPVTDAIKNSPDYQVVKQTYDKAKQFSTYSTNNLVTALNNGTLLPGTKVYNELLNDPVMKQKLTDAQVYTTKKPLDLQSVTQSVSGEILSNNPRTANAFADGTLTAAEYASLTNTPEVTAKATDVEAKTNKYNTLKASYDAVDEEVDKEFPGSRFADDIKADRKKAKYKDLVLAKGELDAAIGTLTELKSQAAGLFEANFKLYQDQQQQANAYKMAEYQAMLSKDAAQYQNQLQQGNVKFETIGNKVYKVQNGQMTDTGIDTGILTDQQKMALGNQYDMQKMAVSNKFDLQKLGISNQADLQKLAMQYNLNNASDIQKSKIDIMAKGASAEQADAIIRNATGDWKGASGASLLMATDGTIIPSRLKETTNSNNGKECAEYVNDITGAGLGSTWESKLSKVNTTDPTVGNTAVWVPDPSNKTFAKYGHAGIITEVNGDNVTIKSSNLNGQGEISTITVPKSEITKTGGFIDTQIKGVSGGKSTGLSNLAQFMKDNQDRGQGYSNDDVKAFNEKIDRLAKANDTNGMAIAYRNMVMKDKDFKKAFDDTQSFTTALDTVQKLVDDYEKSGKNTTKLNAIAEAVGRKLGMTTDTALAQLQTQMGTTMANYIKSISGTAASDAEVQRLMGNMANIGNVKELNTAIVSQVKQNALNGIKSMIDTRMYGMPEELKPQVFGDIYKETAITPEDNIKNIVNNLVPDSYKQFF